MALETLKDVKEIDGFKVTHAEDHTDFIGSEKPIIGINHGANEITFSIQNGPIKENGVNGCQVDTLIETAALIIEGLNGKYPCYENDEAISSLRYALNCLHLRKLDREKRGVEGYSKE